MTTRRFCAAFGALALMLTACGGDDSGDGTETTSADAAEFQLDVVNVTEDGGQDASLAALDDSTVLLAWGEVGTSNDEPDDRGYVRTDTGGAVFVARSEDGGKTFSEPVRVDEDDPEADDEFTASTRNDRPPRMMVGPNGDVHVIYIVTAPPGPDDRFPESRMRIATSTDGGETFDSPRELVPPDLSGGFYGVHTSADGNLHVGYLRSPDDEDSVGSSVRVATSKDDGETFTVSDEFTGDTCQCCPVSFAEDSTGRLAMGWRHIFPNEEGTIRDHVVSFSEDQGEAWSEFAKVHDDQWLLEQCPHSGSGIGFDSNDQLHIAWYTGKEDGPGVYYARADDGAHGFGDPVTLLSDDFYPIVEPSMVITSDDTVWITFGDEREAEPGVWLAKVDPDGTATVSAGPVATGRYPRLALSGDEVLLTYELDGAVDVATVQAA